MNEWVMIGLLTASPLCWMVGGTGFKWVRRFLWPALATALLWCPVAPQMGLTLVAVNSLGYGDSVPWWRRWLVFSSYGLPVLWLDEHFGAGWVLGIGVVLVCLMALSRKYNRFSHKIFEGACGFLQATGLILGALR